MSLVLASASLSRAAMLRAAGVPFEIVPSAVDEAALKARQRDGSMSELAMLLAEAKARAVSEQHKGRIVLGADSILECDGRGFDKAKDLDEARHTLALLRGKAHHLLSAAVLMRDGEVLARFAAAPRLTMRDFSDDFLDAYIAAEAEALLTSVGCYRLEGLGLQLFCAIDGDYFAILGLPLLPLMTALRRYGIVAT